MTHKGIIAIIFVAGIIGMGVYSLNDLIEKRDKVAEQREQEIIEQNEDNRTLENGTNHHVIIDDGVRGTVT